MRVLIICLCWLGLLGCSEPVLAKSSASIAVLQYHHIGDDTPRVTSVTADELAQHIEWLQEHDFNIVSITDALQLLQQPTPATAKLAVLTIDDGWKNVYQNGLPVFKKYQVPFTVFVNPRLMREAPNLYMNWQQLRELQQYGATIANHTNSHDHLTWRRTDESESQWQQRIRADILDAQQEIDEALGAQPKLLAYPYGEYDPAVEAIVEEAGFVAFAQHSGAWNRFSNSTAIPRFPASAQYADLRTLANKINSLALPVTHITPASMVLKHDQSTPSFSVTLDHTDDFNPAQMNCFAGSSTLRPSWQGNTFTVELSQPLPIGRSRVNCTVASKSQPQRFYWYSQPFARADKNGRWPD